MNHVDRIAQDPRVRRALTAFREEVPQAIDLAIGVQQIPSPTFAEAERAGYVERQFLELGLHDVHQDEMHNVFGRCPGSNSRRPLVVSAHTDTVFPVGTDLQVRRENDGRGTNRQFIYGPGLADNAMGVAGLLLLAEALGRFGLRMESDVWLVANVGEEGLGNLRGMRTVVRRFGGEARYLIIEGGSFGHVFHQAVGVKRFRLAIDTDGGHSWGDFGRPSAVHILSRMIAGIDALRVPDEPKTTYNVGVVKGGTAINTIAASAECQLDLRSTSRSALSDLVASVGQIVSDEDRQEGVKATMAQIGDRPSGEISRQEPMVLWASEALQYVGCQEVRFLAGSTDANMPISLGYPAVCIGLARSGNTHRLDEYLEIDCLAEGLGQLLLLTLAAAGFTAKS